jgi:hypothetical protein
MGESFSNVEQLQSAKTNGLCLELGEQPIGDRWVAPAGGVVRMGADGAGEHDDLVMAVALACWKAKRKENAFVAHRLPGI